MEIVFTIMNSMNEKIYGDNMTNEYKREKIRLPMRFNSIDLCGV